MPELPEVEVLLHDLGREVVGRRIKQAEVRPGSNAMKILPRHGRRKEVAELLEGAKVEGVRRAGKVLLLDLDSDRTMSVNLGSTARLLKTPASEDLAPHTHLVLTFTIGGQLRVVDPGLSGEVYVGPREDIDKELAEARTWAIDPLQSPVTWQQFSSLLEERAAPMKQLLCDDGFVLGLGPLYSDEVLFAAGLRYDRPSDDLSSQDVRRLYRGLMETLHDAVRARGTSLDEHPFTDLLGNPGSYQLELKVYGREGQHCRRCRHGIRNTEFNGTPTFFCPQCQS